MCTQCHDHDVYTWLTYRICDFQEKISTPLANSPGQLMMHRGNSPVPVTHIATLEKSVSVVKCLHYLAHQLQSIVHFAELERN